MHPQKYVSSNFFFIYCILYHLTKKLSKMNIVNNFLLLFIHHVFLHYYKRKIKLHVFSSLNLLTSYSFIAQTTHVHFNIFSYAATSRIHFFFINNVLISFIKQNNKYNHTLHANHLILGITLISHRACARYHLASLYKTKSTCVGCKT